MKLVLLLQPDIRDTGGQQVLVLLDSRQPEEALAVELQTKVCEDFIIAEKAPGAFTFRTPLRHYAKQGNSNLNTVSRHEIGTLALRS